MSHTAHIPSHRKPRRSASKMAIRAGVTGGVLSTIAVAGAAGPANAEPVTATIEMPLLTPDAVTAVTQAAEATEQVALDLELQAQLQAQEEAAAAKAAKAAEKARAEADRKAEAEKKKAEEEARKRAETAAQERASRDTERTSLSAYSSAGSTATGSAATVVAFLKAQLGDAYIMGATGPNAWDCSSLVQAAYRTVGIDLPRVSQDQSVAGTQVGTSNLQVGDILYWGGAGSAYHTGVYIGDGQYLDAANPSKGVVIQDLSGYPASGAVRVL